MKAFLYISLILLAAIRAESATVGGIELPKQQDGFELHGAGLLRKGFFFKIYVGALYVENEEAVDRILSEVPKRLDIHYFHHTPKKHMIRVAEDSLKKNLSAKQYEKLLPKIGKLHDAYLNGKKGSCASIIYRPGEGLIYCFENRLVTTIPCDDFANDYFRIWLGEKPSSRTMKNALLDKSTGEE